MKKILISFLFVSLFFVVSGCGTSSTPNTANTSNNTPATDISATETPANVTPAPSGATAKIDITNFTFNPVTLTIKRGTTVTWTNNDLMSHQVKSDLFNSDILTKGKSFSFTFNDAGTINYYCSIHASMTGQIIVE